MATLVLKKGRVQPVWAGHPWVYAQAVERVEGAPLAGDAVHVKDVDGNYLGQGFYSPKSAIVLRIASWDVREVLDEQFFASRFERAVVARQNANLPRADTNGYRLVHAEGDGMPGLIVDIFDDVAAMQTLTLGMKMRENDIAAALARVLRVGTIVSTSTPAAAEKEGFAAEAKTLRGQDHERHIFSENGIAYEVDVGTTQKTGFYFDQRDNRMYLRGLSHGRSVLDLYSYVGAFSFSAILGGASYVLGVDSSPLAVTTAAAMAHRIGVATRLEFQRADARDVMRDLAKQKKQFGIVVLDPPKLAPTIKSLEKARGAYRRLNAEAARLVEPGGWLVTCSCSAAMVADDFVRTVSLGIRDAGKHGTLVHMGSQGADHPVPCAFPEGRYLKCAFVRVDA